MSPEVLKVIIGFVGCGGIASIAWFITKRTGKKSDIIEAIHNLVQKQTEEKIKKTEEKQKVISVNIEHKEKLAVETKKKIKEIEKKAAGEIVEVLNKDSIKDVWNEIDSDWEDV